MNLPGTLTSEEIESWVRAAAKHNVRVRYRVEGQEQVTTREMAHAEYLRWNEQSRRNGYTLVSVEQIRKD